ncbi:MAG: succinate dehydrogenase, hydrophobic membrane anchor protein, partial [Candidatus Competibacterales bacterium]|nr:succinate dehydrogenase, hydrophobic membrane anchor protein [Candidatus Competibacterales bacterium]
MSLRTPLARARGLGSAKEGVQHWWAQRVTAVALVPLTLWFVVSLLSIADADHATVVAWIGAPLNSALLVLLLVAVFYHAVLGLQVVIEDYIHSEGRKFAVLLAVKFALALLAAIAVL